MLSPFWMRAWGQEACLNAWRCGQRCHMQISSQLVFLWSSRLGAFVTGQLGRGGSLHMSTWTPSLSVFAAKVCFSRD